VDKYFSSWSVILIVEDNHLNAMVLAQAVDDEDGTATVCGTAPEALLAIAQDGISAAILDNGVCDPDPTVCNHLDRRGIPYVLHVDLAEIRGTGAPATADTLINKVARLLSLAMSLSPNEDTKLEQSV
jgi:CheY-like chemotaxis protein